MPVLDWSVLQAAALRYARLWCEHRDQAEDVAQEAMLAFVRRKDRIRSPLDWLFIVTRRVAQRLRNRENRQRYSIPASHRSDEGGACSSIESRILLRTFAADHSLTLRERRLLTLAARGYSQREIAERLACSQSAVCNALNRLGQGFWRSEARRKAALP